MNSPSQKSNEQNHSPSCLDISPDRLNKMSPSELADAMEEALDFMTEETYDPDVISAYLDALEQRIPIPEHPNADAAYEKLQQKLKEVSIISEMPDQQSAYSRSYRRRSIWRTGLVAALLTFTLFGGLIIAQACGLDVFGAIARWTEEAFSFGELPTDEASNNPSTTYQERNTEYTKAEVPPEYNELKSALDERGLPFRIPVMPQGFEVAESLVYIHPKTNNVEFTIVYMQETDAIKFEAVQFNGRPNTVHEKDNGDPEEYRYNDISHYIFENAGKEAAVWVIDNFEYSLSTNSATVSLKQLIKSFYEV